jgi:hypothetical protein
MILATHVPFDFCRIAIVTPSTRLHQQDKSQSETVRTWKRSVTVRSHLLLEGRFAARFSLTFALNSFRRHSTLPVNFFKAFTI